MKSEAEAAAILCGFEERNDIFAMTVDGISVWCLIRGFVGYAIQDVPLPSPRLSLVELLLASLGSAWQLCRLKQSEPVEYVVRSYASALRFKNEGTYGDVYFEGLLERVPRGVRMHSLNASGYAARGRHAHAVDCTGVRVLAAVLAKIFPKKDEGGEFSKLSSLIVKELDQQSFTREWIVKTYSSIWWQSRVYEWILTKIKPKVVIAADTSERALIAASKRLGIKFIELQHGVFNPEDPDCLPLAALERGDSNALLLPDALAMYGDYWVDSHSQTAMGGTGRLYAVGSDAVDRYRRVRKERFVADPNTPRLLVTTQGMDRDALVAYLIDFLRKCDSRFLMQIKLHPIYDKFSKFYIDSFSHDPRVVVISESEEADTFHLIAMADVHISIASACHFDALGIGVPTVIIPLAGHGVVSKLVSQGDALIAFHPAELAAIVEKKAWRKVDDQTSSRYFRSHFVDNLSALMTKLAK